MYTLIERRPGRRSVKSLEQVQVPAPPTADPLDAGETMTEPSQLSSEKGNASGTTSSENKRAQGRPSKQHVDEIRTVNKKTVDDEKLANPPHGTRNVVPACPLSDPLVAGALEKTNSPSNQEDETRMEDAGYESSLESSRTARGDEQCFVLTCLQKSKKFFHAPRDDPDLFRKWAAGIPQRERALTERDLICADHFKEGEIRTTVKPPWGKVLPLADYKWKLSPGAIPTVFRTPRILLQRVQTNHCGHCADKSDVNREVKSENIEKCVVPGCGKFRGTTMHEFTFYMPYRKYWVREISRKTGVSIPDNDEFLFGKKVCAHHFLASHYQGGVRSNPLKLNAVPSRFELVGNSDKRSSVSSYQTIHVVHDKELGRDSVSSTGKNGPTSENEILTVYEPVKATGSARRRKQSLRPGAPSSKIASVSPSARVVKESPEMNATGRTESAKQVQQPISISSQVTVNTHSMSKPVGLDYY